MSVTKLPPSSPIDLRVFVLYDKYQQKTVENSFENYKKLCETMRKEVISVDEYEYWFKLYSEENERDLPMPDIRVCILSDVINGKSAEKSIDDLYKAFGFHKINKEDHNAWYKRFASGYLFNTVNFSDLPEVVFAEILKKCDLESYLNLRNVSRCLRAIVDNQKPVYTDIKVFCSRHSVEITVNSEIQKRFFVLDSNRFAKLEPILRNPKLRLESFQFIVCWDSVAQQVSKFKKTFFDLLKSINHKIHVEDCSIDVKNEEELIDFLQNFKPGTLETLDFRNGSSRSISLEKIVEMDHWKQAKRMRLAGFVLPSIDNFLHFTSIEYDWHPVSMEDLVQLCKELSKSDNFEVCTIKINGEVDKEEAKNALNLQLNPFSPEFYSIPNLNLSLYFWYDTYGYVIFKK